MGAFPGLVEAGQAVAEVTRRGLQPAALELLDRTCLRAVEEWKHLGLDPEPCPSIESERDRQPP